MGFGGAGPEAPGAHTRRGLLFWGEYQMREYNEYTARVAECEQRAKDASSAAEKQSWLVMADSWRETSKLQDVLKRQAELIRKISMPSASVAHGRLEFSNSPT